MSGSLVPAAMWAALLLVAPAGAAPPEPYKIVEDVVYGHKDGLALTLDVMTPVNQPKHIGLILVSSGGWRSGKSDVAEENEQRIRREHWVQGLLQGGYTLFVTRHGSGPRYRVPEMVDDVRRAVRFVRLHAKEYGVDPDKLGITSGSSGGHLSLMVATTGDDGDPHSKDPVLRTSSRVQAVVAWFPPTDLVNWGGDKGYEAIIRERPGFLEELIGSTGDVEAQLKGISPAHQISADDPPLLLLHGDKDPVVPLQQSELMKAKYAEAGLPVELVVAPGGVHSYWPGLFRLYPQVWEWFDRYLK